MKSTIVILLLLKAALVFASEPQRVTIQLGVDPKSLDPAKVTDLAGFSVVSNVVLPIMTNDSSGKTIKGLASKVEMSKDGLTYSFQIRKDARAARQTVDSVSQRMAA